MRTLVVLLLLLASLAAQVLRSETGALDGPRTLRLPARPTPGVVVVEGSRAPDAPGDLRLSVDGRAVGMLSRFAVAPGRFVAHLDVLDVANERELVLEPGPPGMSVGPVEVVAAAAFDLEVLDEETRKPVPAVVRIVALDGREPPLLGYLPEQLGAGAAVLLPEGRGRLLLPAGGSARLLAYSHPFRKPCRRSVQATAESKGGVRFLLGADVLPEGSVVLEAPLRERLGHDAEKTLDRVLGIGRRLPREDTASADAAQDTPEAFVLRLLAEGRLPPLLTEMLGPCGLPAAVRPLRSVRFPDGSRLHSNGPVIQAVRLRRVADPGRGSRVRGELDITGASDVVPRRLLLRTPETTVLDLPLKSFDQIPLDLNLPPGTRLLAFFEGVAFSGDPPGGPRPLAMRVFVLP